MIELSERLDLKELNEVYEKNTKDIKQNIQCIKKSIETDTHNEQQAILSVVIAETIEKVRTTSFKYEVPYTSLEHKSHMYSYGNHARRYIAKLVTDLYEIQKEIGKRKTNTSRCLMLLTEMLETSLYMDFVQMKIDKWQAKAFQPDTWAIYVKGV